VSGEAELTHAILARRALGAFLGPDQGRQQQRREDGDDRDIAAIRRLGRQEDKEKAALSRRPP